MTRQYLENIINSITDEAIAFCKANCRSDNPLEAWTCFVTMFDMRGRKKIGEELKNQGRNPYTGELK